MRNDLLRAAALATLLCGLATAGRAEAPFSFAGTPGQLPKSVVPSAYDIAIVTDMRALRFTGHESVTLGSRQAGSSIVLNQAGLTLTGARLDGVPASITQDQAAQTATLRLPGAITDGQHTLTVDWNGPIPATPNGIYVDDYRDKAGAAKRMLVTQFEVADARRMFPGWDEPAFKATFHITATLPDSDVPVANMPVTSHVPAGPGLTRFVFATTPRMSSYLLALVAGEMADVHGTSTDGRTPVAVWAPTGEQDQGGYALGAAREILPYYNDYFGVAYPLPKLDLVAVPGNYAAGAMENWGDITFIDNDLLLDPATSGPDIKERIYVVVAHEMAHQWSGDLVTMGWWSNIWLNEGFATWMETKATDHFNPSWQMWPRAHADREMAMAVDARATTHPIQQDIRTVSQAESAFDLISYQKGEQVIRMVESWLGPHVFRDGMRAYVKAHAYSNASSADLWAALSQVSHRDVAPVATSFTEQPGIPLVSAARACAGGRTTLTLSQSRFSIHDPKAAPLDWLIPVTAGGPGLAAQTVLLGRTPARMTFAGCDQPIKIDLGETGYYRSRYDAAGFAALKTGFDRLDATDRVNLLGDQFALFEAGDAPLASYLDLVAGLGRGDERSMAVWEDTLSHLRQLDRLELGSPQRPAFRAFARSVLQPVLSRLGWTAKPGESFLDTLLRPKVIAALGQFQDQAVIAEAQRRFAGAPNDPAALPASLLSPVLGIVGAHADSATAATLARRVREASGTEEKLSYFNAYGASADPARIRDAVRLAWSGAIPNGRIDRAIAAMAADNDDPVAVWTAMRADAPRIMAMLAPEGRAGLLSSVAAQTGDPAVSSAMLADPVSRSSDGARIRAAQAAEQIAITIAMRARTQPALAAWLGARKG